MSKRIESIKSEYSSRNQYYVYILLCADGSFYTGITNNLDERIDKHNLGIAAKYTRGRGPVKLVYHEYPYAKSEALKREIAIKKLRKVDKIKLIETKPLEEIE